MENIKFFCKKYYPFIGRLVLAAAFLAGLSCAAFYLGYASGEGERMTVAQSEPQIKGNRRSRKYHLPGCPNYRDVSDKNIVWFSSEQEAREAGFVRAGNC